MRIKGFDQIKAFNSWVFNNQDKDIRSTHIALYFFMINQNNRVNWAEWFKLPYDIGMTGSGIGSRNTYYKCLQDLQDFGLIEYKKGINDYKAPKVKIYVLNNEQQGEQAPVPLSEPLSEHLVIPLSEPLSEHIYKLLTNNLKLITDNIDKVVNFLGGKKNNNDNKFTPPTLNDVKQFFKENKYSVITAEKAYHHYNDNNWYNSQGKPVANWKSTMRNNWFKPEAMAVDHPKKFKLPQ